MALLRVYCGVAAAEVPPWLTAAVVDDSGRLLDLRHLSDDPAGYAHLTALLADRSATVAAVAIDRGDRMISQLLAAAHRPLAIADDAMANDFAERFSDDTSYDEMRAPHDQRRAIGLARALQAGAVYASTQHPTWNMDEFMPVLGAHTAVTGGRQAAAAALRDVLRELYPAALRAYADPADVVPLRILDALPEPGMLSASPSSRQRESALIAELSASGVADTQHVVAAITALRVAVDESPRSGNRFLGPVVAETVRQAVAAVRACDAASASLVASLVERLSGPANAAAPMRPYLVSDPPVSPVSPAPRRVPGPAAEVPPSRLAPRASAASAAAAGVPASPNFTAADFAGAGAAASAFAGPAYQGGHQGGPFIPAPRPAPGHPAPGSRSDWPLVPQPEDEYAAQPARGYDDTAATTLSFSADPLNAPLQATAPTSQHYPPQSPARPYAPASSYQADPSPAYLADPSAAYQGQRSAYHGQPSAYQRQPAYQGQPSYQDQPPAYQGQPSYQDQPSAYQGQPSSPYQADQASPYQNQPAAAYQPPAAYASPPAASPPAHTPTSPASPYAAAGLQNNDPLTGALPGPPQLRVIDGGRGGSGGRDSGVSASGGSGSGSGGSGDGDLLIFSDLPEPTAWFTQAEDLAVAEEPRSWGRLADDGWRAAGQLNHPSVGIETTAGLPRRVPQANLVPGSAQPQRSLRIVRDARSIAAHTEGYFRGWRRGQEIGGFAIGQRDRAAWEFNRDQRARESEYVAYDQRARLS